MKEKKRVLIVEDNSDLRRLYAIGLNQRGYEVKLASNGAEAIERIASDPPDLILLDLIMPVMDGWEVIDRIASSDCGTRVIVISGQAGPSTHEVSPVVEAWLEKPVTIDELAQRIGQTLEPKR